MFVEPKVVGSGVPQKALRSSLLRKKPAAPPPIIAVRFAIVFVHSLLIIITMSEELSHR